MTDSDLDTVLLTLLADDLRAQLRAAETLPPPPNVTPAQARANARQRSFS